MREGLSDYLQLVLDVGLLTDPNVIWRKLLEIKQMKPIIEEETWPLIDQFFCEVPEAIQKLPSFQEALLESQRYGQQQTLIRLLRHKFGEIPVQILQHIEATSDKERLDRWLDQVLDVNSLTEIHFFP